MVVAEIIDARERLLMPRRGVPRGCFEPLRWVALEVDFGPMVERISCQK